MFQLPDGWQEEHEDEEGCQEKKQNQQEHRHRNRDHPLMVVVNENGQEGLQALATQPFFKFWDIDAFPRLVTAIACYDSDNGFEGLH